MKSVPAAMAASAAARISSSVSASVSKMVLTMTPLAWHSSTTALRSSVTRSISPPRSRP